MVQFPCQVWLVKMLIKQRHDFTGTLWMGCNTDALKKKKKKCLFGRSQLLTEGIFFFFFCFWTTETHKEMRGKNFSQVRRTPTQREKTQLVVLLNVDCFELMLSQQHTRVGTHAYAHNRDMLPGLVFFTVS